MFCDISSLDILLISVVLFELLIFNEIMVSQRLSYGSLRDKRHEENVVISENEITNVVRATGTMNRYNIYHGIDVNNMVKEYIV